MNSPSTKRRGPWADDMRGPRQAPMIYDVVTVPTGTSALSCASSAFSRIRVRAVNAHDAVMDIAVVRSGRTAVAAVPAGDVCDLEVSARAREQEQIDRVNIPAPRIPSSYEV